MTPLSPDRWHRVQELFVDALQQPPSSRAAWLDAQCSGDPELRHEIDSLLSADSFSDADAVYARAIGDAVADAANATVAIADRIGPYCILREIGHGGMATVFLARRDDEFEHHVAIKVVRGALGADGIRRFRAERQILASLEHPSIARLFDGGTTSEGVPYFVMEYVEGDRIDTFCTDNHLTVPSRLALFCRVCAAVNHAHRSFVVHRDIKPSNILVTADGTPKLLDFGIAKLLSQDLPEDAPVTRTGQQVLTPEYASPEQIRGEPLTTASDVYSLGVLLYELLTGERPLAFSTRQWSEIERIVCTVEPGKPSTRVEQGRRSRELAGDLDTIVLTALAKEPSRRYPSAAALADDLRRHLSGLPVSARPATWGYRSGRFVRRHRVGVVATSAFALLVAGFGVALAVQMRRVTHERDTAAQVANLLLDVYGSLDPTESHGKATPQEVLDRGALRVQTEFKAQPELQARMLDTMGAMYAEMGLADRATAVLQDSLAARQLMGQDSLQTARTLNQLANALRAQARFDDAVPLARRALDIRQRLAGPRAADTAEAFNTLGLIQTLRGHTIEGAALSGQAVAIWRDTPGPDSEEFADGLRGLARAWRERADYLRADRFNRAELLKAERVERERLAARRRAFGDNHTLTTDALTSLGCLLHAMGRNSEAEPVLREALTTRRKVLERDDAPSVVEAGHNLALVLHDEGRLNEAEPLYRRAVTVLARTMPKHPQRAIDANNLGTLLEDSGRWDEAEAAYREALGLRRQLDGQEQVGVARTLNNLARLLLKRGRAADARPLVQEALTTRRATLGDLDFETLTSTVLSGAVLSDLGQRRAAEPLLREGLGQLRSLLPEENLHVATAEAALARLLAADGRSGDAGPLVRQALATRERLLYPGHPLIAATRAMALSQ